MSRGAWGWWEYAFYEGTWSDWFEERNMKGGGWVTVTWWFSFACEVVYSLEDFLGGLHPMDVAMGQLLASLHDPYVSGKEPCPITWFKYGCLSIPSVCKFLVYLSCIGSLDVCGLVPVTALVSWN